MNAKEKYLYICDHENARIFSKPWWLDAVAGEKNWDVILIEKNNEILAAFPYYLKKKSVFKYITMPRLTPFMEVWINRKLFKDKTQYDNTILQDIINQLPRVDYFNYTFDYSLRDWLPFYWSGYNQTTYYSYIIDDLSDLDSIYHKFSSNVKRNIKKGLKNLNISYDEDVETFYKINKLTFERQGIDIPYSLELIKRIDEACTINKCKQIIAAKDHDGNIHSAIYLVWDNQSAYYLMGGTDPKYRNSGSMQYLMWEAIKFSSQRTVQFDFEGSIIKSINTFFRAFGGVQHPYFKISKLNSKLLLAREFVKELTKLKSKP